MSLPSGTRLRSYEILSPLGAGGMGEVYKARDTRLGRDVALKTLPVTFTRDPERLARFRREAQVLATLNHPHIGSIYGLEETDGQQFLVLELVEGETLATRLARGPLPVDEALAIAREIAEALEGAHAQGIIHRDLKPANIALTSQDRVKVLDFGLAKATEPTSGADRVDALHSPTITSPMTLTALGVILGTAAYMSPEQAKGRAADKRSDVWAFGCVLYEMLTGRRPFKGDDVSDTLAAVLKSDPDWAALPDDLPPGIRALLEGCLQKHHRDRIGDISAALFVLKQPRSAAEVRRVAARAVRWPWMVALLVLGGVAGAVAAIVLWPRQAAPSAPLTRFAITLPAGLQLTQSRRVVTISPDGTKIVYTADGRLYLRALSDFESRPVAGADPAVQAAFSPDGGSLVFWSEGTLKRLAVAGGVPVTVCSTQPAPFGIRWTEDGILFVQPGGPVLRVSPNGGTPERVATLGAADVLAHGAELLPGGETLLLTIGGRAEPSATFWDNAEIVAISLKTGARKTLVKGSDGQYVATGHLLYMHEGTLMAVRFDPKTVTVHGGAVPVVEGVRRVGAAVGGAAHLAVSDTGTLVYVPGPARGGQDDVFLYDRKGASTALQLPRGSYSYPRVSPDGKWLAFETSDGKNAVISVYELAGSASPRRLTFGGNNRLPIWSRDGRHVVFQSDREGDAALYRQRVDGSTPERLTRPEQGVAHVPESWSRTADLFLFRATKGVESTLWTFSVPERKAVRFGDVASNVFPTNAVFSPDGRWVAYQAGDGGNGEPITYVQPYPPTGTKYEIARGGRPLWSPDGTELFLVPAPSQFIAVKVKTSPTFSVTAPIAVPRRFGLAPPANPRPYDILPDGRFVAVDAAGQAADGQAPAIHVVLNWFEELKSKVPETR